MKLYIGLIGAYFIIEALIAMLWKQNDLKWYAQLIRTSRIVGGSVIICVALFTIA